MYSIQAAAQRSGLTVHVIRAWERRYGALHPQRSDTRRRLFTEEDVERLTLLKTGRDQGRDLATLSKLPMADLRRAVLPEKLATSPAPQTESHNDIVEHLLALAGNLEGDLLALSLARTLSRLGTRDALHQVILPFITSVGDGWHTGQIRIAEEHLATNILTTLLCGELQQINPLHGVATLVVATPRNQRHELGALIAGIAGALAGWHAIYLGGDLPAEEIIHAARVSKAKALALSIVYPLNDPELDKDLRKLGELRQDGIEILVGGDASQGYADALQAIGARQAGTLCQIEGLLSEALAS